jgi:ABC-type phosphate transport system substrate-binding protein
MAHSNRKHVLCFSGAALAVALGAAAPASAQLACGGASSVKPAVDAKFLVPGCDTYTASGSGAGRTGFADGSLDVASSDATKVDGAVNVNALNVSLSLVANYPAEITKEQVCAAMDTAMAGRAQAAIPEGLTVKQVFRADKSGSTDIFNTWLKANCPSGVQVSNPPPAAPPGDLLVTGSQGVIDAVKAATPDTFTVGVIDTAVALAAGSGVNISFRDFASGPNYFVFPAAPADAAKAAAAKSLCQSVVSAAKQATALPLGYVAGADANKPEVCDAIKAP